MRVLVFQGGSGNFGDTAMLEGVVSNLARNLPRADLFVTDQVGLKTKIWDQPRVHKHPMPDVIFPYERLVSNLPYLWRYEKNWRSVIRKYSALGCGRITSRAVRSGLAAASLEDFCAPFDALHLVGGGYLTDTFPEVLMTAFCLSQAFAEQKKPVLLTGQQVGPFRSRAFETLVAQVLRRADFVGLREPTASLELCQKFRVDLRRLDVMGDDSFGLPFANEKDVLQCLAALGVEPGQFLAFNVRVGSYAEAHRDHVGFVAQIAEELSGMFGLPALIVPIAFNDSDSDDLSAREMLRLMRNTKARAVSSEILSPSIARGLLGKAFGAIGNSYHFCTFALSCGVPAVALHAGGYYTQKARGICRFWQDKRLAIAMKRADVSVAANQIAAVLRDRTGRQQLASRADSAIQHWRKTFDAQVQRHFGKGRETFEERKPLEESQLGPRALSGVGVSPARGQR